MTHRLSLPLLAPHDRTLQKCVYCPKLCRASCPVANVEGNETVTPWGKMTMAYFAARGDVPMDGAHAEQAWACSACLACRERCEHDNEVATVLFDARAEAFAVDAAPPAAQEVARSHAERAAKAARVIADIDHRNDLRATTALLMGCGYALEDRKVAEQLWKVAEHFVDEPLRAVRACCGLPLLQAGDRPGFATAAQELVAELEGARRVLVADPGCARTLLEHYPRVIACDLDVVPLVDVVYAELERVPAGALAETVKHAKLRYHDPCQLGRGLGRYEQPRAILERLTNQPPAEFTRSRQQAECSGAGALLPSTRPDTSRKMAVDRIAEHRALGGGVLVTACSESRRRFRSAGEPAVELMSLVAEACLDGDREP